MNNYAYPAGADNKQAPWNKPNPIKIPITICLSISKDFEIEIEDYERDAEGQIDPASYDIQEAVKKIVLPSELSKLIRDHNLNVKSYEMKEALEDCSGWFIDDITTIPEGYGDA